MYRLYRKKTTLLLLYHIPYQLKIQKPWPKRIILNKGMISRYRYMSNMLLLTYVRLFCYILYYSLSRDIFAAYFLNKLFDIYNYLLVQTMFVQ